MHNCARMLVEDKEYEELELIVDENQNGSRLDIALANHPRIKTRSQATKLIEENLVEILNSSKKIKPSLKVHNQQIIKIKLPLHRDVGLVATNIPLNIVFEDQDIIIINKPAGLVVHPSAGHEVDTLVNALMYHTNDLAIGLGEMRPGIVHRIDKDTSGLLVVAKNNDAQTNLQKQFEYKTNKRVYWAICFGILKDKVGTIETEIGRHPTDRKKMAVLDSQGKKAISHYEVLNEYKKELSLVKLTLETGRTHQIRVHMNHLGCPIIADWMYCSNKRLNNIESKSLSKLIKNLNRFALHAAILGIDHPRTKEYIEFNAGIPQDLLEIIQYTGFQETIEENFS